MFASNQYAQPNVYGNYPPNQPPMQSNYPPQMPPDRNMPPNMMNPQFKNYPMQQMMIKPPNHQRPPPQGVYHQGGGGHQPPPQYMSQPQMPPSQMNHQMNPNMNHMMMPNMNMMPNQPHPQGQGLPPQMPPHMNSMNNPGYPPHMQMRRQPPMENPQIKMEHMPHENQMIAAQNMRKKPSPPVNLAPINHSMGPPIMPNQLPGNIVAMNPMSPVGNSSPTSNSQNQLLNSNTKDHAKSKPSELNTLGLKLNNYNISGYDIVTKIFFGKKQIVWELVETGSVNEKKEPHHKSSDNSNREKEEDQENQKNNEELNTNKKKFDIKFSDIEAIEINVEKNTMTIGKKLFKIVHLLKRNENCSH